MGRPPTITHFIHSYRDVQILAQGRGVPCSREREIALLPRPRKEGGKGPQDRYSRYQSRASVCGIIQNSSRNERFRYAVG
jgi:hypothetical protein